MCIVGIKITTCIFYFFAGGEVTDGGDYENGGDYVKIWG